MSHQKSTSISEFLLAYETHGNDCVVLDFDNERAIAKSSASLSYIDTYIKLADNRQVKAYLKFSCLPIYGCKKPSTEGVEKYTPAISFLSSVKSDTERNPSGSDSEIGKAFSLFCSAWEHQI